MLRDGPRCIFHHAVNNRAALERFLASEANVAEGDVLWGTLVEDPDNPMAIMAHPPSLSSDLSFKAWVRAVITCGSALKIDIKTPRVMDAVIGSLHEYAVSQERLIINADVVLGPAGAPPALNTEHLLRFRHEFPTAVLSPSASTSAGGGSYTREHINALLEVVALLGAPTTVPLRAEFVLADPSILEEFSRQGVHITIWNDWRSFAAKPGDYEDFRRRLPNAFIDLVEAPAGKPIPPPGAPTS